MKLKTITKSEKRVTKVRTDTNKERRIKRMRMSESIVGPFRTSHFSTRIISETHTSFRHY